MINLIDKIKSIKILDQLELDNKKIILITLVGAIILYVDFNFIFKAQTRWLGQNNASAVQLKKDLDSFKIGWKKMREAESKPVLAQQQAGKNKKLASESQVPALLQDISKIANNNEVRILQIKPYHGQGDTQESRIKLDGKLTRLIIALDLSSGYHNLGKFINELENLQVFLVVQEIKIEPQEASYLKHRIALTLIAYVKK